MSSRSSSGARTGRGPREQRCGSCTCYGFCSRHLVQHFNHGTTVRSVSVCEEFSVSSLGRNDGIAQLKVPVQVKLVERDEGEWE